MLTGSDFHSHGLLTPIQNAFIDLFNTIPDKDQFYLTGGTALAEYYLGHRLSYDLDFFTAQGDLIVPLSYQIENRAQKHGLGARVTRRFASYVEFEVTQGDAPLKVDLAQDSPFRFQPPIWAPQDILVNSYSDICTDKLLAFYGRAEPRDAVDLYFILQRESLEALLEMAAQKDTGFDLYWFAIALQRVAGFPTEADRWPVKMLAKWDPKAIQHNFMAIATDILADLDHKSS